jgi:four helix bundle protein
MQSAKCRIDIMDKNTSLHKSFEFAVRIVNLYKYLTREHKEYVISKQLLRCGTSIGANVSEAQKGQSKADFTAKMCFALKEANETEYWLKLLYRTEYISKSQFTSLDQDVQELISLLTAICRTASQNK